MVRDADLFMPCPQLRAAIRGEAGTPDSEADREALALAELEKARTQVHNLREDLDAAQRHVEQYRAIAAANEATLEQAAQEHRQFREAAEQAQAAAEAEAEGLRARVAGLEGEVAALRAAAQQAQEAAAAQGEAAERARQAEREEVARLRGVLQEAQARAEALKEDGERTRREYARAQAHYEQQVSRQRRHEAERQGPVYFICLHPSLF